ncbi:hypothetical protein AAFP30_15600 [Gordonia sp. CPCC 205515]|uniref:hypothetical protein n=1 Tax=Gordonia sp. CPCC 205515 TaxID=3140791 RepID=UPI003AF3607D
MNLPTNVIRTRCVATKQTNIAMSQAMASRYTWLWRSRVWLILAAPTFSYLYAMITMGDALLTAGKLFYLGPPVMIAILGLALHFMKPWRWRYLIPLGTELSAEFGPDWVGIGWADNHTTISFPQIRRVEKSDRALRVVGDSVVMVFPDQLVPPQVAASLLAWFGPGDQHERPIPMPQSVSRRPQRPDGVIRTYAIVDAGLPDRLTEAVRKNQMMPRMVLLALVPALAMIPLGISGARSLESLLVAVGLGVTISVMAVYFVCIRSPKRFGELVRPGEQISADFGPDVITVRLGGHSQSMPVAAITAVARTGHALSLRGDGGGRRMAAHMIIPDELVPPQVGEQLLRRFGSPR